jgi:hypothetical protein
LDLVALCAFALTRWESKAERAMGDIVYLALIVGGFAICWLAVGLCERL